MSVSKKVNNQVKTEKTGQTPYRCPDPECFSKSKVKSNITTSLSPNLSTSLKNTNGSPYSTSTLSLKEASRT